MQWHSVTRSARLLGMGAALGLGLGASNPSWAQEGLHIITTGSAAGTIINASGGVVSQPGIIGFIAPPHSCPDFHFHGMINGIADPDPDGCGWGLVAIYSPGAQYGEIQSVRDLQNLHGLGPQQANEHTLTNLVMFSLFFGVPLPPGTIPAANLPAPAAGGEGANSPPTLKPQGQADATSGNLDTSTGQGLMQSPAVTSTLASWPQSLFNRLDEQSQYGDYWKEYWHKHADEIRDRARQWRELAEDARENAANSSDPKDKEMWERDAEEREQRAEDLEREADKWEKRGDEYGQQADDARAQAEQTQNEIDEAERQRAEAARQAAQAAADAEIQRQWDEFHANQEKARQYWENWERERAAEEARKARLQQQQQASETGGTTPRGGGSTAGGDEGMTSGETFGAGAAGVGGYATKFAGEALGGAGAPATGGFFAGIGDFFKVIFFGQEAQATVDQGLKDSKTVGDLYDALADPNSKIDPDTVRKAQNKAFFDAAGRLTNSAM